MNYNQESEFVARNNCGGTRKKFLSVSMKRIPRWRKRMVLTGKKNKKKGRKLQSCGEGAQVVPLMVAFVSPLRTRANQSGISFAAAILI